MTGREGKALFFSSHYSLLALCACSHHTSLTFPTCSMLPLSLGKACGRSSRWNIQKNRKVNYENTTAPSVLFGKVCVFGGVGGGEGGNGAESFSLEVFILPVLHLPSTLEAGVKRDDFLNLTTRNKRKWCFLRPQFLRLL